MSRGPPSRACTRPEETSTPEESETSDHLEQSLGHLDPVFDRLNATCTPHTASAVSSLLGAIGHRKIQKANPEVAPLHDNVRNGDLFTKSELLQHSDDGFDYDDFINDPSDDPTIDVGAGSTDEYLQVQVHGSPEFQTRIRAVLQRYKKVFSSTLPAQPARVTPLRLDINESEWHKNVNRMPHRRQSTSKDAEINAQTRVMLDSRVIT